MASKNSIKQSSFPFYQTAIIIPLLPMVSSRVLHKNTYNFFTFCRQKENALPADPAARFLAKGVLERREVEKRIYGGERQRLTASATFLLLRYFSLLNTQ
jgi:hypothetical protein